VDRPIIMPLSNPTTLAEATPDDLLHWTQAKAIIATGSPFTDVLYEGGRYRIAQSNNALAFPGIGLGAIAVKAHYLTENMLWAATQALTASSPINQNKMAPLLPKLADAKIVSLKVALAVASQAQADGVAEITDPAALKELIKTTMWEPRYYPYRKPHEGNK
jgi:malate dehydrogenase (oxaloacetate-decarboxylating)